MIIANLCHPPCGSDKLYYLKNDRLKGLQKLFALFRPQVHFDKGEESMWSPSLESKWARA